jgi:hypothetical protein
MVLTCPYGSEILSILLSLNHVLTVPRHSQQTLTELQIKSGPEELAVLKSLPLLPLCLQLQCVVMLNQSDREMQLVYWNNDHIVKISVIQTLLLNVVTIVQNRRNPELKNYIFHRFVACHTQMSGNS